MDSLVQMLDTYRGVIDSLEHLNLEGIDQFALMNERPKVAPPSLKEALIESPLVDVEMETSSIWTSIDAVDWLSGIAVFTRSALDEDGRSIILFGHSLTSSYRQCRRKGEPFVGLRSIQKNSASEDRGGSVFIRTLVKWRPTDSTGMTRMRSCLVNSANSSKSSRLVKMAEVVDTEEAPVPFVRRNDRSKW